MPTCVPWGIDDSCCDDWDGYPSALKTRAEDLAWSTMRTLSGGRIGNCPAEMRPCLGPPCDPCRANWMNPAIVGGIWVNCVCGGPRCSCSPLCEIVFPGEIAAIVEVDLGGELVDLSEFRIDNGNRLVRMGGECWPSCQELGAAKGEPGTLTITYVPGILPSSAALWAAGTLACEYAKACSGAKCRLPTGVTTIARQGVAFTMSTSMFADGMTGIREVDAYLASINPAGIRQPSMVWSPDTPWSGHRYTTRTAEVTP